MSEEQNIKDQPETHKTQQGTTSGIERHILSISFFHVRGRDDVLP